ncbi:MAG: hypothetical protein ACLRFE_04130 [Clostridia bacterium]
MKFFKKLKSSNFWVSMVSAVVLILQAVFNVDIKTEYLNQIILGILGVLVMTGIVTDSPSDEVTVKPSFDMDGVKETINTMFTQISNTFQSDMAKVVSQLNNVTQISASKQLEDGAQLKQVVENNVNEQVKNIQPTLEVKLDVENAIQPKQDTSIELQQEVVTTHVQEVVQDNAPINEL